MKIERPRVYTIAPGGHFLDVLAKKILAGFPLDETQDSRPLLSDWTILLPTRRAARALSRMLYEKAGHKTLLLPNIRPIGDLDEEHLAQNSEGDLPNAISATGQLFIMLELLQQWAAVNPQLGLAREIAASQSQCLGLAESLLELVEQVEIEEIGFEKIAEIYDVDLSSHRAAILSLLAILQIALPQKLHVENLLGAAERRSRLIRMEATHIMEGRHKGPLIAAGSTGTIPATRALLKAIANYQQGAVIIPGLDCEMGEDEWQNLAADHPQHSLKTLIAGLDIIRSEVLPLEPEAGLRNWASSEIMRSSQTTEKWHGILQNKSGKLPAALKGINLIEAPNRHIEARSIALILRHALEIPDQRAALVTPDRDLASRVKAELARWNISIEDTAGVPLTQFGIAALAQRLLDLVISGFSTANLVSLLRHPDCNLGLSHAQLEARLNQLEVAVMRGYGPTSGLQNLKTAFERTFLSRQENSHLHPVIAKLSDDDWQAMQVVADKIVSCLAPLDTNETIPFLEQLSRIWNCLQNLAPQLDYEKPENQKFLLIWQEIQSEAVHHTPTDAVTTAVLISHLLRKETVRNEDVTHARLAIYGVLEARLMPADVMVLGGLNEGKWPSQPDSGPWLNRPMRKIFGLNQPEREIGVSAHDFVRGFAYPTVYLTWSKRLDDAPQIPSRWILRLRAVLKAANLPEDFAVNQYWVKLAEALDESEGLSPVSKPRPAPPNVARPNKFSVTEVEKLIRDPYAIYARKILRLEPLPDFARQADPPLRGTLFHEAIGNWNKLQPHSLLPDCFELLIAEGKKTFAPFMGDPEISSFWWPRFKRMARWLCENEPALRQSLLHVNSEISGQLEFEINDIPHKLTVRADRIDQLENDGSQIIDYKTGIPPSGKQVVSGLSPQLPLEAAILLGGGFDQLAKPSNIQLLYIQISGGLQPGKIVAVEPPENMNVKDLAQKHLNGFKSLLGKYANSAQHYLPRVMPLKDQDEQEYDHLSRFKEWMLAAKINE